MRTLTFRITFAITFLFIFAGNSIGQSTHGDQSPLIINPKGKVDIHYEIDSDISSRWSVEKAEISMQEKKSIIEVLDLYDDEKYSQAKQQLLNIQINSSYSKKFQQEFLPAILMSEKDYSGALEAVIKKYKGLPASDLRYRWQIAYITYFYRRNAGVSAAEKGISRLQKKYKRKDISHVWMAIHPNAFSRLLKSDLYPYQNLHEKQLAILKHVVESYPSDHFIDHALYFLHEYDKIINQYPDSIIIDRAYYAKAYLNYYQNFKYFDTNRKKVFEIGNQFEAFITKFPNNTLTNAAFGKLANTYLYLNDSEESFNKLISLYKITEQLNTIGISDKSVNFYNDHIDEVLYHYFFTHPSNKVEEIYFKHNKNLIHLDQKEIKLQIARRFFNDKIYEKAYHYYKQLDEKWTKWRFYGGEKLRIKALERIVRLNPNNKKEYLYNLALHLKNTKYDSLQAIPLFDEYMEKYAEKKEIPKIMLLKAYCYRNADRSREMIKALVDLVNNYPRHRLADDALADVGVSFILNRWERERGREILRDVIKNYPDGNAVDNSYNWIAWSYMKDDDYKNAFSAYVSLLDNVGYSRFADYAFRNLQKLAQKDISFKNAYRRLKQKFGINYQLQLKQTENKKRKIILNFDDGTVKILEHEFTIETKIYDFKIIKTSRYWIARVKTEDSDWKVQYSWDLKNNDLYYRAMDKRTGRFHKSPNLKKDSPTTSYIKSISHIPPAKPEA